MANVTDRDRQTEADGDKQNEANFRGCWWKKFSIILQKCNAKVTMKQTILNVPIIKFSSASAGRRQDSFGSMNGETNRQVGRWAGGWADRQLHRQRETFSEAERTHIWSTI